MEEARCDVDMSGRQQTVTLTVRSAERVPMLSALPGCGEAAGWLDAGRQCAMMLEGEGAGGGKLGGGSGQLCKV